MPSGVEHSWPAIAPEPISLVHFPLMPKGVEHAARLAVGVRRQVWPVCLTLDVGHASCTGARKRVGSDFGFCRGSTIPTLVVPVLTVGYYHPM